MFQVAMRMADPTSSAACLPHPARTRTCARLARDPSMHTRRTAPIRGGRRRLGLLFAGLCALNGAFVPAVAKLTTARGDALFVATVTTDRRRRVRLRGARGVGEVRRSRRRAASCRRCSRSARSAPRSPSCSSSRARAARARSRPRCVSRSSRSTRSSSRASSSAIRSRRGGSRRSSRSSSASRSR